MELWNLSGHECKAGNKYVLEESSVLISEFCKQDASK
jgi:hypothetical protein